MLLTNIMNTCYNGVILLKFIFSSNFINFVRIYVKFSLQVFDERFERIFH